MDKLIGTLMVFWASCLMASATVPVASVYVPGPWNLPVVPEEADRPDLIENAGGKSIPRHLWMAFKDVPEPEDRRDHLVRMIERNEALNWTIHLEDNAAKTAFMEKYYRNTSVLWAYHSIHPKVGIAAADIWRYCVLWMFGGFYLDDDSYLAATFDELIGPKDRLIVATERNKFNDDCFIGTHHLSGTALTERFNKTPEFLFDGRTLVNWGIAAAPRHPILLRAMTNLVELIKMEYLRVSVVYMRRYDARWKICMCTTGPAMLTASAREYVLELQQQGAHLEDLEGEGKLIKVVKRDFHDFGGVFKVPDTRPSNGPSTHYMFTMQQHRIPLLREYSEFNALNLEGKLVTGDGKEIFLVQDFQRRGFKDFDSFLAMDFRLHHVKHLDMAKLLELPLNSTLITEEEAREKKVAEDAADKRRRLL